MDNLWAQGQPVFFYASVESTGQKHEMLYRVQIFSDTVLLASVRGGATMAAFVQGMQEGKPEDTATAATTKPIVALAKSDISGLRSEGSALIVETSNGRMKIIPQVAFVKPAEGWTARAFMNDYADLFSTYLGLADVQLGAESTTAGDRWRMIGKIALASLAAYAQGGVAI